MKSTLPSVAPRIQVKDNKLSHIQNYDSDNNYPGRILDIIKSSGTATSCANLYAKFINGKGFKDQKFWKSKVNRKGVTVDKLLRGNCRDVSRLHGYALHINYNALFQVNEVTHVPFDHCRLCYSDDNNYVAKIAVYDDWACKNGKLVKEKVSYIDVYNRNPDVILSQVEKAGGWANYKGQIFWRSFDGDGYPLSIYDPVIEDVMSDSGIKKFRLRTTSTSFMPSHIIEYPYEFESEEERQSEKENWEKFQGSDNANKIIMMENPDAKEEGGVKITKVDWQGFDKVYETTNRTVKDSIIEVGGTPPVLLGVAVSGKLGTADEIRDAYMFYNSVTSDERKMMEEDYTEIFSNYRNPINMSGDYSIIPLDFNTVTI